MEDKRLGFRKVFLTMCVLVVLLLVGCQDGLSAEEELANRYFNLLYAVETTGELTSQSDILSESKARQFELEKLVGADLKMVLIKNGTLNDILQYAALHDYVFHVTDVVLDEGGGEDGLMAFDYTVHFLAADELDYEERGEITGVLVLESDGERLTVHEDSGLYAPTEWRGKRLGTEEPLEGDP